MFVNNVAFYAFLPIGLLFSCYFFCYAEKRTYFCGRITFFLFKGSRVKVL